jgi:hypothetical protein
MEVAMPVQLFTEAERARRNRFPEVIAYDDLVTFFTLTERDLDSIPRYSAPHNRLGYALQLCTLRFMGFVPDDLTSAPPAAVAFLAQQLTVEPDVLAAYGARPRPVRIICSPPKSIWATARWARKTSRPWPIGCWSGRWSMTNQPCSMN